jgi:peptide/nickel transport system substrate-binding protein
MTFSDRFNRREVLIASLALAAAQLLPGRALAEAKRGGILTIATQGEPRTLVPLLDTNTLTRNISTKVTEGLLTFDTQFNPKPLLAAEWQVSPDGLEYAFRLRPNVKWHDGTSFASEDVKFSLLALKKVGPRGRISFANIADIETPDPLTAVVKLAKPTPYFLKALTAAESPIVPKHAYASNDLAASPNNNSPIGTGPFIFEEWKRGAYVRLKRNPSYWRADRPYLDGIVVKFIGDPAAASTALETGETDVSTNVSFSDLERLSGIKTLQISSQRDGYLNNASVLEFNLEHPELAKTPVRHAIAHAIDRNFIRDSIYYGQADQIRSPIPEIFPAYHDSSLFDFPTDVAKANRLLDEAGVIRGRDGTRFSVRLTFIPGPAFKTTADYLRSALGQIGIRVTVLEGDLATFIKRVYYEHQFDLNVNGLGLLFDPTVGVQRIYWSDGINNPLPYVNAAHYNNPAVDDLFRQASTEADEGRRAHQFRAFQKIASEDLPALPLVSLRTVIVSNSRVRDIYNSVDLTAGDFSNTWLDR